MKHKALVDMDLVVYRVGHACDNWHYEYLGDRYDTKRELIKAAGKETADLVEKKRDPEDWEDVKKSVVDFIEDLIEGYADYQGFISGKGNFFPILLLAVQSFLRRLREKMLL